MPTTLTALLAAVIHDARSAEADPTGVDRAAGILAFATGGAAVNLEVDADRLLVNGLPIDPRAPGAELVIEALGRHWTVALGLPPGLTATDWRAWGELYTSARGRYPTPEHLQTALLAILPEAEFRSERNPQDVAQPADRPASRLWPNAMVPPPLPAAAGVTTSGADRGSLSLELDPLLADAREAVARKDWQALAGALISLDRIERGTREGSRMMIVHARRRVVPTSALQSLVRVVGQEGRHSVAAQALLLLRRDGAEAIIEALAETSLSRADRRVLLDILARMRGIDDVIIGQLASQVLSLARDMAEVAGRRRIESAAPTLATLLRHADESVRAASWRALEEIGTPEALALLSRGR